MNILSKFKTKFKSLDRFDKTLVTVGGILCLGTLFLLYSAYNESGKYESKTTYTKISEPRFSVHSWDSDEWTSPSLGWWHDKNKTLTLSQLIKTCSRQVCTISNLYIPPSHSRPTEEIYTVSELRQILQSPHGIIKKFDGLNGFVIDLRKP